MYTGGQTTPHESRFLEKTNDIQRTDMLHMGVSENGGTPKSSILIGFSIINHPF